MYTLCTRHTHCIHIYTYIIYILYINYIFILSLCQRLNLIFSLSINASKSFPGGPSGKEPTYQCRRQKRLSFDPWVGEIPWKRTWQPTSVLARRILWTEEPSRFQSTGGKSQTRLKWLSAQMNPIFEAALAYGRVSSPVHFWQIQIPQALAEHSLHKPCVLAGPSLLCVDSSQDTAALWIQIFPWGVEEVILLQSVGTCPSGVHPTAPFSRLPFKSSTDTLSLGSHYASIFPLFPSSFISFCESRLKTLSSTYALCLLHVSQPND